MSLASKFGAGLAIVLGSGLALAQPPVLRVCADPNNMPFSNQQQQGFENHLAHLAARDLGMKLVFVWWPQRRGAVRNTLNAGYCDVEMGVPSTYGLAQPTRPYYQSTYVFVERHGHLRHLNADSLDDPELRTMRVGVHVIGGDTVNFPPAQVLANRGIIRNVVGYSILGDYSKPDPPADLLTAVSHGDIDVAIAWGPLAGYFAKQSPVPLTVVPVCTRQPHPDLPFVFAISMGVRHNDPVLLAKLNSFIVRRRPEIHTLLRSYGVPLTTAAGAQTCK